MAARPRSLSHLEPLESLAGLAALGEPEKTEVEKLRSCLDGISSSALGSLSSYNNRKGQAKGFWGLKETQAKGKKNLKKLDLSEKQSLKENNNGKHSAKEKSDRKRKRRKGDVDDTGWFDERAGNFA